MCEHASFYILMASHMQGYTMYRAARLRVPEMYCRASCEVQGAILSRPLRAVMASLALLNWLMYRCPYRGKFLYDIERTSFNIVYSCSI